MQYQNVVIVGGSFAGHNLANMLAPKLPRTHRILLIEQNDFTVHLPGVVRGLVDPGWEEGNLTAPTRQETVFKAGERHRVLAPVCVLKLLPGAVLLDTEFEGSTEVPYSKCIIATGATQSSPLRPSPGESRDGYKLALREVQDGFKKARHVLIVGGGAVGVEVAGEITTHFPKAQVTIVHGRDRLLVTGEQVPRGTPMAPQLDNTGHPAAYGYPFVPERVSAAVHSQLSARGVDIILNDRVQFPADTVNGAATRTGDTDAAGAVDAAGATHDQWDGRDGLLPGIRKIVLASGRVLEVDCVFGGSGTSPNSSLVAAADPSALARGGYVAVGPDFRVLSSAPALEGVFALGDVANTGGRKTAGQAVGEAHRLARVLVTHLACEAKGQEPKRGTPYAPRFLQSILIPLGEGRGAPGDGIGAGSLDLGWLGVWGAPQWLIRWFAKEYFCTIHFVGRYKGQVGVGNI